MKATRSGPNHCTAPPAFRKRLAAAFVRAPAVLVLACFVSGTVAISQQPAASAAQAPRSSSRAALFLARRGIGRPGQPPPAEILMRARAAHAAMLRARAFATSSPSSAAVWQAIGPAQVSTSAWNLVTGRVTSIAADPSDLSGNTVYVGTTGGGVWKSTNAASAAPSFLPLTDTLSAFSSASLASLSIGAVSVQPVPDGVILAGTGDPNDATDSWYGAGILRSTDGGNTWSLIPYTTLSNSSVQVFTFAGSAFAGFAWNSVNPDLVVAAVTQSERATLNGVAPPGALLGLFYSQDAGATWQPATIEDGSQVIQSGNVAVSTGNAGTSVVWNPIRRRFYAAVRYHGYYESLDGITWSRLASQPGANLTAAMCPTNPGAAGSPACPIFRGALAVQPVTGDMFALTVDSNDFDQGLWRDSCSLVSNACASPTVAFSAQIPDQPLEAGSGKTTIAQADYNLWLAAVPSQQDTLLLAGTTDIWRCNLANGCAWRNTTNTATCAAAQVAPFQHSIDATFGANGLLFFGNDGGLWRTLDAVNQQAAPCSSDDAAHFQNLNSGLGSLAQVESFSEDPNNPSTWLAALGDLGTAAPSRGSSSWNQVLNGEGNVVAVDPLDPENWYATSVSGVGINRCAQGTACELSAFGNVVIGEAQVSQDAQTIPAPWILDPQNTTNIILGTCRVWRAPASGIGWSSSSLLSGMLDGYQGPSCDGNAEIRSLAAAVISGAPSGPAAEQIYAGIAGTLDGGESIPGHIFTATVGANSQEAGTTWTDLYASPITNGGVVPQFNPGGFDISSLTIDPHDPTAQTIFVTVQGYSTSPAEPIVYLSTDAGAHWTNISSNLPNAPANSIAVDPNNANIVYVALDSGVYVTQNVSACSPPDSACWNVLGSGLPNAPAIALMTYNQGSTQVLRAATWGRGIWEIPLETAGMAPTTASVAPAPLTFPGRTVQTASTAQTITIENTGTLNLNIATLSITGDFSETDSCAGQSIAPSDDCTIQVVFDPTQTGSRAGTLTVFANVAGGQLTDSLSGTGLTAGAVTFTPTSLSFSPTTVGSTSSAQSITIANTGESSVNLTAIAVSGDFVLAANPCGTSLAGNSSCTVNIAFMPSASGTRSGALNVTDSLGTQTVALSGVGQTPATDSLSSGSLSFAAQQIGTTSASQQIILSNSGDQPLTGIAVTVSGDFTAVNNCGSLLQGHGSCSIPVSYVPTKTGAEPGTLTVTDEFRSQTVALSGTGLAPPGISATPVSINFGGYAIGSTSSVQTVTVTNNGGFPLTALASTITSGFAIAANNCPATLALASACQIGITFSPSVAGPVTGSLTISAANLPRPLDVSLYGAGQDFSLTVSGSSSAVVTSGQTASFALQLAGLSGTAGAVALACSGAPQNATCSLNPVSLNLTGLNTSSATVTIATGVGTVSALRSAAWRHALALFALLLPLGCAGLHRRRFAPFLILLFAVSLVPLGCGVGASSGSGGGGNGGGSGGNQNTTPTGTYPITVTGTMSNITHKVTLTLTVQ